MVVLINIEQTVLRTLNKWSSKECWIKQQIAHLQRKNGKEKMKRKGFRADNKWMHCLVAGYQKETNFLLSR
ncbi:hypothetical protein A3860_18065 [Niastella vici]|uniref:Uncharacterized protein n=1 Tax=Niastella vici TaxID=1703345 RepID=A0A1V9G274_9BACT|nr:hypothetical protein A3860_18065 [Niastella vici]